MTSCRICRQAVKPVLDLGSHPLPEEFRTAAELNRPVKRYPVTLAVCPNCYHVQLEEIVNPDTIYKHHYHYDYSYTPQAHWRRLANQLYRRFNLNSQSLVIDLGCNSGVLLSQFKKLGIKTAVGVDPNPVAAGISRRRHLPVYTNYFTPLLARKIRSRHGLIRLITCTNTFDHVDDLDIFVEAVCQLLYPEGTFVIEVPYLRSLLRLGHLPYHQQIDYFALTPLFRLFSDHNLILTDAQLLPIHGGSLRVYAAKTGSPSRRVYNLLKSETRLYKNFSANLKAYSQRLTTYLYDFKTMVQRLGKTRSIAAIGASAKGIALLNYCHLDSRVISFISEVSPLKTGRFTPSGIPIVTDDYLMTYPSDFAIVLAWNFAKQLTDKLRLFPGKFIIPLPRPTIL